MADTATESSTTRRYDSEVRRQRAARTRADVLAAAHALFVERGWGRTGVRDIAAASGVSVKTIYDVFGSKANLFTTVLDVAVAGDDEPVTVMEREEFGALARGELADRVRAGVGLATAVNRRTAELMHVQHAAADDDSDLAARRAVSLQQQRETATTALRLIAGRLLDADDAVGLAVMAGDQVYRLLVHDLGWSEEQYASWLARFLLRQLDPTHPCSGGSATPKEQE